MTVSYNKDVITTRFSILDNNMIKLLFRWRGSVYKLIWGDCIIFVLLYTILQLIFQFGLSEHGQRHFVNQVMYFNKFAEKIPLSWILGFYVGIVIKRWWEQFKTIPWPDNLAFRLNAAIKTTDDHAKMTRRTIIRYTNLGITLAFMRLLDPSNKNNPYKTLEDLVEEGLLMHDEKGQIYEYIRQHKRTEEIPEKKWHMLFKMSPEDGKPKSFEEFWIPLTWAINLIKKAKAEELIKDEFAMRSMIAEIIRIRSSCAMLLSFDWINVPLVYTQVVTISVYSFFLANVLGSQYLDSLEKLDYKGNNFNYYVPVFTLLQFVFFIGWLKVAEILLNPFGGDDEDFEIVYLIKRNKQAGYAIVDDLVVGPTPPLRRDPNWDDIGTELNISNVDVRRDMRNQSNQSNQPNQSKDEESGQFPLLEPLAEKT